jgi:hypothetical protein
MRNGRARAVVVGAIALALMPGPRGGAAPEPASSLGTLPPHDYTAPFEDVGIRGH